eukprot:3026881-Prymnesium_polylepis.1
MVAASSRLSRVAPASAASAPLLLDVVRMRASSTAVSRSAMILRSDLSAATSHRCCSAGGAAPGSAATSCGTAYTHTPAAAWPRAAHPAPTRRDATLRPRRRTRWARCLRRAP